MTCSATAVAGLGLQGGDAWVDGWVDDVQVTANDPGWFTGA